MCLWTRVGPTNPVPSLARIRNVNSSPATPCRMAPGFTRPRLQPVAFNAQFARDVALPLAVAAYTVRTAAPRSFRPDSRRPP